MPSIKKQMMPDACLDSLTELREQVIVAGELLSAGEHLAALRRLMKAKVCIRQSVISTIVDCLKQRLSANRWNDQEAFERDLFDIFRLIEFTLITLCPECKQQISVQLKK